MRRVQVVMMVVAGVLAETGAVARSSGGKATGPAVIKQVFKERGKAIAGVNGGVENGSEFVASDAEGRQCVLKVVSVQDDTVTLDTRTCRNQELRAGQRLERSLLDGERATASAGARGLRRGPAAEWLDTEYSPGLMDYGFMPRAEQFVVNGGLELSTVKTAVSYRGSNVTDAKSDVQDLFTRVAYGLREDFAVDIKLKTSLSDTTRTRVGEPGSTITVRESGFYDPVLGLQYRALTQGQGALPLNVFLRLEYSPGIGEAVSASETTEGNQRRGGSETTAGIFATRDAAKFSARAGLRYTLAGTRTVTIGGTRNDLTYEGGSTITLDVAGLYKVNELFGLLGGLSWSRTDAVSVMRTNVTRAENFSSFSSTAVLLGTRFQVIPERLLVEGTYTNVPTVRSEYQVGNQTQGVRTSSDVYALNVTYAF